MLVNYTVPGQQKRVGVYEVIKAYEGHIHKRGNIYRSTAHVPPYEITLSTIKATSETKNDNKSEMTRAVNNFKV